MRVLMVAIGSRGDVQPLLALGLKLRTRGHEVVFTAQPNFEAWMVEHQFPFHRLGLDTHAFAHKIADDLARPLRFFGHLMEQAEEGARNQFALLPSLAANADVLVSGNLDLAGPSVASHVGIPHVSAHFFPGGFPTRQLPPPALLAFPTPRWSNRMLWKLAEESGRKPLVEKILNPHRKRLGLPPYEGTPIQYVSSGGHVLIATDPQLGQVPTDVTHPFHQTGFWFFEDQQTLPPELEAFLRSGPPPLYIGLGSMVTADTQYNTRLFVEAVTSLGCRAVLSSGWAGLGDGELPDSICRIGPVSHHALLPRMRAAVHHGGSGTTAAVARAGIPQLILPHLMDQYYWGREIHRHGLGPKMLKIRGLKAGSLQKAMAQLLRDDGMQSRAQRLGERLKQTQGLDNAVAYLEQLVKS